MRRIALLLAAAMLTLVGTSTAASALTDPYGAVNDTPTVTCVVSAASSPTAPGTVTCTVSGLKGGTSYQIVIQWQPFDGTAASFSASLSDGATAFVGAQGSLTTTIDGTANPNGNDTKPGVIPAGADSSKPATIGLTGTAADGTPAVAASVINAQAAQPTAPTTPATGAESGILALISLALVAAGAGAVLMTRRRSQETVA